MWSRSFTRAGGEQLAQRDLAERWVQPALVEVRIGDQLRQHRQVVGAQSRELLDERVEGDAAIALQHGEAVETVEGNRGPRLEDPSRARDPIGLLARDEVTD